MAVDTKHCENCNRPLVNQKGVWLCKYCNSKEIDQFTLFRDENQTADDDYIFIECPGATLYEPGTNEVEQGVKYHDRDDPLKGYEIVGKAVFAPTHKRKRRIKKDALGKITRCQACQDYTVRMRRREGADFFIPSTKYPGRKKLKTVQHTTYEP